MVTVPRKAVTRMTCMVITKADAWKIGLCRQAISNLYKRGEGGKTVLTCFARYCTEVLIKSLKDVALLLKTSIPETIGKNKIKQINREPIAFLLLTSIKRVRLPGQSAKRQLVQN